MIEGNKAHQLACSVIIQTMKDAFLLKKISPNRYRNKPDRKRINLIIKTDAVTWLKGENDIEGFKEIVGMTNIDPSIIIQKAREWFTGEHKDGYEFNNTEELYNALGIDLRAFERDLRRAFSDNDYRW